MKCTAAAVLLLAACVPTRDYSEKEIAKVESLKDLMRFQYTITNGPFRIAKRRGSAELTADEYARFADVGQRLQASAERLFVFDPGGGFNRFVRKQRDLAEQMEGKARARDASATLGAARALERNCDACHAEFR